MRTTALALVGTLLAASPALAFDGGNVEQPERLTTQSGQTAAGPIATSPLAGGSSDAAYGAPPVVAVPVAPGSAVEPGAVIVVPAR